MFKKHHCEPRVFHIIGIVKETGGEAWVLSEEEFDNLFCGQIVWNVKGMIWGIQEISHGECVKIFRSNK
jgi:hypothetical protein